MKQTRRTLALYKRFFANKTLLDCSSGSAEPKAEITLFPNGKPEIWVQSQDGSSGFAIEISSGPMGMGVHLRSFAGTPPITITSTDGTHPELCQYKTDEKSQAYRRWYLHEETDADISILGEAYRRPDAIWTKVREN